MYYFQKLANYILRRMHYLNYKIWGPALAPWNRPRFRQSDVRINNALISKTIQAQLLSLRAEVFREGGKFFTGILTPDLETVLRGFDTDIHRRTVIIQEVTRECSGFGVDVGTAYGWIPLILDRYHSLKVVGTEKLDKIPVYTSYAVEKGVEIVPWSIPDTPPFRPSSLDFIVFTEVLEHLKLSPKYIINQLANLLKPGGRLILSTPNIHRLENFLKLMRGDNILESFKEDLPPEKDPTDYLMHVREYTITEIIELLKKADFEITRVLMCDKSYPYITIVPSHWNTITIVTAQKKLKSG